MKSRKEKWNALWREATRRLALILTAALIISSFSHTPVRAEGEGDTTDTDIYQFVVTFKSGAGVFEDGVHSLVSTITASEVDEDEVILNYNSEGFPETILSPDRYTFIGYCIDNSTEEVVYYDPVVIAKDEFTLETDGVYRVYLDLEAVFIPPSTVKVVFDAGDHGSLTDSSQAEISVDNYSNSNNTSRYWYYTVTPNVIPEPGYFFAGWKRDESSIADLRTYDSMNIGSACINDEVIISDSLFIYMDFDNGVSYNNSDEPALVMKAQYEPEKTLTLTFSAGEHGHFANSTEQSIVVSAAAVIEDEYTFYKYKFTFDLPEIVADDGYLFRKYAFGNSNIYYDYEDSNVLCINSYDRNFNSTTATASATYAEKKPVTVYYDAGEYGTISIASESAIPNKWEDSNYCYPIVFPEVTVTDPDKTFLGWRKVNVYDETGEIPYYVYSGINEYTEEDTIPAGTDVTVEIYQEKFFGHVPNFSFVAVYGEQSPSGNYKLKLTFNQPEGAQLPNWISKDREIILNSSTVRTENGESVVVFDNVMFPKADFNSVPIDYYGVMATDWMIDIPSGATNPIPGLHYNGDGYTTTIYEDTPTQLKVRADSFDTNGEFTVNLIAVGEDHIHPQMNYYCPQGIGGRLINVGNNLDTYSYEAYSFEILDRFEHLVKIRFPEVSREPGYKNLRWKVNNAQGQGGYERVGGYYNLDGTAGQSVTTATFEPGESIVIYQEGASFSKAYFELESDIIPLVKAEFVDNVNSNNTLSPTIITDSMEPDGEGYYQITFTMPAITPDPGALSACWMLGDNIDSAYGAVCDEVQQITFNGNDSTKIDEGTIISVSVRFNNASATHSSRLVFVPYQDMGTVRKTVNGTGMDVNIPYTIKPGTWKINNDGYTYTVTNDPTDSDSFYVKQGDNYFEKQ